MTQTTAAIEAELVALTDAWVDAEVQGDRAALERILDEGFLVTYASGRTGDRDQYVDMILAADISPFEVTYENIEIHGDTAVVVNLITGSSTKIMWAAIKRDGRWRAIAQTFSSVASPES